jgi:DNA-binding Lrp family transcriptional regulator
MMTENEKKVLKLLLMAFGEDYSINQIAKKCKIAPNGAIKILRKLEKENVIQAKNISNIKSYKLNFENEKTKSILELALFQDIKGRLKFRYEDLKSLKQLTELCIVFGSYIGAKENPNDIDLLLIIRKEIFRKYKEKSKIIYQTIPIKVHEILQTEEDIKENILNKDNIIIKALRDGIIFWGYKKIVEIIEDGYKK